MRYGIQVYDFDETPLRVIPVGNDISEVVKEINKLESIDNGLSYKMITNND